jgi:hypothetical protein
LDNFADAMVNLSMVGSLFFSVSFDASRERILLYLVLTAVPLALVVPIISPILDASRVGNRTLLAGTQFARAALSIALAGSLGSLAFYPLVFGVLLSRKVYALTKTALMASLVDNEIELVTASGYIARAGTIFGGLGTAVAGALLSLVGVSVLPVVAAVGFATAAVASLTTPISRLRSHPHHRPSTVAVPIEVEGASTAVAALRAGAGALTFLLALAIKRGGGDVWVFATALVAAGVGSFAGTFVAGRAHRRLSPDRVIALCLLVPGLVALAGVLSVGRLGILVIATGLGLGGSVASRSMEVLYGRLQGRLRSRAISYSELRFQLANVAGASLAVLFAPSPRVGFGVVGVVLVAVAGAYAASRKLSLRRLTGHLISGDRQLTGDDIADLDLFAEAKLASKGSRPGTAIVLAAGAARIADIANQSDKLTDVNAVIDSLMRIEQESNRKAVPRPVEDASTDEA